MKPFIANQRIQALVFCVFGVASAATLAQNGASSNLVDSGDKLDEVVVTGTLIRGVAPVGTSVIEVKREDILASGKVSAVDLIASLPQDASFGSVPSVGADLGNPTNRVDLRSPGGISGGDTTLVLLNGHRMVGVGVIQTVTDPSFIPATLLDHMDVVLDGGSSIYGADAVGGVVNFVTRKKFAGVEAGARYSAASPYHSADVDLTTGFGWGSGSATLSLSDSKRNDLQGQNRAYTRGNLGTSCALPNIIVGELSYALPGRAANTSNTCYSGDLGDTYPSEERIGAFGTLTQTFSTSVELNVDAYYSQRKTRTRLSPFNSPFTANTTIDNTNPFFTPIGTETSQGVQFSYLPAFGVPVGHTDISSVGFTPSLVFRLGGGWQLKAEANYGKSSNTLHNPKINTTAANAAIAGATTATALDPYDLTMTDPSVLAAIGNWEQRSGSDQKIMDFRLVADGTVTAIPGGDVKAAVGAEHRSDSMAAYSGFHTRGTTGSPYATNASRSAYAAFGDLIIPLVGAANAQAGVRSFEVELSARYDHYSDFGNTTNPKIGLTYRPVDSVTVRGSYGTSFTAPSFGDTAAVDQRYVFFPPFLFKFPDFPNFVTQVDMLLAGGQKDLKPQKATTYSFGVDFKSESIKGLQGQVTYYSIDFKDLVSLPAFLPGLFDNPALSSYYILHPTQVQLQQLAQGTVLDGVGSVADLYANGHSVYAWIDARRTNLARTRSTGLDFAVSYAHEAGAGSAYFRFNGTYRLSQKSIVAPGAAQTDDLLTGVSKLHFNATAGYNVGNLSSGLALNHNEAYTSANTGKHIFSFDVLNLSLAYRFTAQDGLTKDLSVQFNIDNLLNRIPPIDIGFGGPGPVNGQTLGRMYSLGVRKNFK